MPQDKLSYKRRWRYYQTSGGACPVEKFLDDLSDEDAKAVLASMKDVRDEGTRIAHYIRNEIYEVISSGKDCTYRVLFSQEGKRENILLALVAFQKNTMKVPDSEIKLAEKRLADWRSRAQKLSR